MQAQCPTGARSISRPSCTISRPSAIWSAEGRHLRLRQGRRQRLRRHQSRVPPSRRERGGGLRQSRPRDGGAACGRAPADPALSDMPARYGTRARRARLHADALDDGRRRGLVAACQVAEGVPPARWRRIPRRCVATPGAAVARAIADSNTLELAGAYGHPMQSYGPVDPSIRTPRSMPASTR